MICGLQREERVDSKLTTCAAQLEAQCEGKTVLRQQLADMETDFSQKYDLMREETARVVERVQAEADRTVQAAEENLKEQLDRKEVVEEDLAKERRVSADLGKKLPQVVFRLRLLCCLVLRPTLEI